MYTYVYTYIYTDDDDGDNDGDDGDDGDVDDDDDDDNDDSDDDEGDDFIKKCLFNHRSISSQNISISIYLSTVSTTCNCHKTNCKTQLLLV
jgi:hypothetical protein